MIHISNTPKPRDRVGSIPIRSGRPLDISSSGPHLPRRQRPFFLWIWLKMVIGIFLMMTLVLVISSPLLVPYLATTLLAKKLTSTLNRQVNIPWGEFNPLTCTLTLHNFIVGPNLSTPNDPVDPLLSAGSISISFVPKRLLGGELACNLSTEHFFLHLVRLKNSGSNLDQPLTDLLSGVPALPLRFSWNTITLSNSRLVFDDERTGKNHFAEEIELSIPPVANAPGPASPFRLQAKINGTPITLTDAASLNASPSQFSKPLPAKPEPSAPEGDGSATAIPENPAIKTAEAITVIQDISQFVRAFHPDPIPPPVKPGAGKPLAP